MTLHRNSHKEQPESFAIGDKVYLVVSNMRTMRPAKKLDAKKLVPFPITEVILPHVDCLSLPKFMKVHNVFHVGLLQCFHADEDFHQRQVAPPLVIMEEGEEEYLVEKIVGWEKQKSGLLYRICWQG